jgi:hypothetical protein
MPTLNLSSEYHKLAYLDAIGITPLVAVRTPGEQLRPLKILVKPSSTQQFGNKETISSPRNLGIGSELISSSQSPDRRQDVLSVLSSARNALQEPSPRVSASAEARSASLKSLDAAPLLKAGLKALPASSADQNEPVKHGVIPDSDANPVGIATKRLNQGPDLTFESQVDEGLVKREDKHAAVQLPMRFSVLVCTSGNVSVIALEQTLTPDHWNLIRNIVLASNPPKFDINELQSAPTMLEFHWPIPGIDPSVDQGAAAQFALSGFLAKQTNDSNRLIVLGDMAAYAAGIYLDQFDSSMTLKAAALGQMLSKPESKRDLWREMRVQGFA